MSDPTQAMPTPEPGGGGPGGGGTVLAGRYRLEAVAGRGGMAEVWRARDTVLDRVVAVKWFTPGAGDVAAPARQQAEMKLLAGFNHPGLVTVYDAGVQPTPMGDRPFVVMEFVDGPTLAARLARGPMPQPAVTAIGSTVADALAYVHDRGVVHRDIKPGNILLEGGDDAGPTTVKLADFGIARLVDDARVTKTGMTVGTASYLSPEQVRGEEITPKSDVYSLALVLLEAFTGSVEFPGSPVEAAVARLNRDPVIPGRLGPTWGPLLAEMTARDPALRPTARQVADRLSGSPGATGPASATTSYIPATGATASIPPTGGVPRPVVAAGAMPPVRALEDVDPGPADRPPRPIWPWIVGVLVLLAVAAVVFFLVNSGNDSPSGTSSPTSAPTTSAPTTPTTSAPTTSAPTTPSTDETTPEDTPTPTETTTVTESVTPPPTSSTPTTPTETPTTDTPTTPTTTPATTTPPAGNGAGNGLGNGGGPGNNGAGPAGNVVAPPGG